MATTLADLLDIAAGILPNGDRMQMSYQIPGVRAMADLMPLKDGFLLTRVEVADAEDRGKGFASELLGQVCAEADRCGQTLFLDVAPDGTDGLDADALRAWYERAGFVAVEGTPRGMVRAPR